MKIIALGDTHGRSYWKQIVSNTEFYKVVFIGDYFDSREGIPFEQQKSNFEDIITFKKENKNKVVLLFGNHDYHYLKTVNESYDGFQAKHKTAIQEMLHSALESNLMQMCFVNANYIFTHAGVTQTWLDNVGYTKEISIELFINDLFKYQPLAFKFTRGEERCPFGDEVCQTPIWVRP
jgi:predicted MPP superfamily phosphohydrolase